MKKTLLHAFFTTVLFAFLLPACSKDKEDDKTVEPTIYGTWQSTTSGDFYFKSGEPDNTSDDNVIIEIKKDGTGVFNYTEGDSENFTWKSDEYPDHVLIQNFYFIVKSVTDNNLFLLADPAVNDIEVTNETLSFGVKFKKIK
ncbi:hypothetical protein [Gynurincola endophyticus]|uniref:hypothetical protein n=1 Tax=Gynurincola endophyticus TaxID=2479004 RepID=UPI000F8CEE99|nr:hypothetical protein [Gynurincola endophyticus]